jgi:putative spermidine/putrescine transport system substrate-binding protein
MGSGGASIEPVPESLVADAKAEGALRTIGLPRTWCGYGTLIDAFAAKHGLTVTELDPNAVSADQVEVLRTAEPTGPQFPDTVDLGLLYGPEVRDEDLTAPYTVTTWDTIPEEARDPDGHWWGGYYGVVTFEVLADKVAEVPADWNDLLKPAYEGQISLAGDPRDSGQAVAAVVAAALASGGSLDDVGPGLAWFRELAEAGNLATRMGTSRSVETARTPIVLRWSYLAVADRTAAAKDKKDPDVTVVVPRSGRLAVPFVQAVAKEAPHPAAARLWQEYLLSDEGQAAMPAGGCHPIRLADLRGRGVIASEALDSLPDAAGAVFPTAVQLRTATTAIEEGWETMVGKTIR